MKEHEEYVAEVNIVLHSNISLVIFQEQSKLESFLSIILYFESIL